RRQRFAIAAAGKTDKNADNVVCHVHTRIISYCEFCFANCENAIEASKNSARSCILNNNRVRNSTLSTVNELSSKPEGRKRRKSQREGDREGESLIRLLKICIEKPDTKSSNM
ncbi:hypothetical protein M5D96_012211, partial [Drosophila gunungcola]